MVKPLAHPGEIGNGRSRVAIGNSKWGSNSATYLTARIARDRLDILSEEF
jgi:hypothetical protein